MVRCFVVVFKNFIQGPVTESTVHRHSRDLSVRLSVTLCILWLNDTPYSKNVKCKSDYSVQNDESLRGNCTDERRVRKRDKKVRRYVI